MATVSTNQYTSGPIVGHGLSGNCKVAFGTYTYTAAPSANDLINLCKIPKNSLVVWGFLATDDIDTGTETLEIDVGYTANGGASATLKVADGTTYTNTASSASATGLIDSGVLTGDTITDLLAGMNWRPFQSIKTGPKFFSEETLVQAKITAAAAAGGTGTVFVVVFYLAL